MILLTQVHEIKFDEFGIMEDAYAQEESTKDQLSKMNGGEKEPDGAVGGAAGIMATTTQVYLFLPCSPNCPERHY